MVIGLYKGPAFGTAPGARTSLNAALHNLIVVHGRPDALGSRTVVARWYEVAATSPAARVDHVEGERVWQFGWRVLLEE